jgi:eukaryotic-like serine/threonine-protein kinase
MQHRDEPFDSLTTNAWHKQNEIVRRFEDAWRAGQRPAIDDFVPSEESDRQAVLVELVFVDLERRLEKGDAVRVETYLKFYPELRTKRSVALDLIAAEYRLRRGRGETVSDAEYLQRFPDFRDELGSRLQVSGSAKDTGRRALETPSPAAAPARSRGAADRNLLFGILALQMDFISRDALIAAMNAWVLDKTKPLGQILLDQRALRSDAHPLLEALVQKHLDLHDNDPEKSLASVSSVGSLRDELERIGDPDVQATLPTIASARAPESDPSATRDYISAGESTSAGQRFRILRPHAKGGLGEVFVARDEELRREVALKQIQERYAHDIGSRARFVLEAEVTGGLEHPGIVPVYGLGQYADGRPFYAMRFVKGDSLKEAIERYHKREDKPQDAGERALEFRRLLGRFVDVCNAIGYAHSRGVLHRDLKPGNILLGPYGETLVVDWGLAKVVGRSEGRAFSGEATLRPEAASGSAPTMAGSAVGTPQFMSPEQAAGKLAQLGPATDVYSLGATLYCLLTGQAPFHDVDADVVLSRAQKGQFSPPRTVNSDVPKVLEAICQKAMALRPEDRYSTTRALANDIEHWLADEPVYCYAEPLALRAGRWARKHKPAVATAAAALLTATVGLAIGLIFVNAARKETEQARRGEEQQRITAQESEEKAKTEAATSTAVKDFLQRDLLQLASARQQFGQESTGIKVDPDLKVRDLLLRAAKKIEGKFSDQPLVEAEIRRTLGGTLREIGRADLAIPQDVRALEIYTAKLDPDHPDTLATMHNLANSYDDAGRTQEALKLREETLKLRKAKLGPDHPDTLASMNNLAVSYYEVGRRQEAIKLHEETLKLRKTKLGPDHPDTFKSMHSLAFSYAGVGRTQEALRLNEETLKLRKAKLGPDHPDTFKSMDNLAVSYDAVGRRQEAIKLHEETLKLRKTKLGPDHPETLESMMELATSYRDAGRIQEALRLDEETLKLRKAKLGPDHPDTLASMNNLANSYSAAGRTQEALKFYEETLKLVKAKLGPDHPETLLIMYNIACVHAIMSAKSKDGREADAAMNLLKQAVAAGYKDVTQIEKDDDLKHLRSREDFKKLLGDLKAKQPEKK